MLSFYQIVGLVIQMARRKRAVGLVLAVFCCPVTYWSTVICVADGAGCFSFLRTQGRESLVPVG